MLNYIVHLSYIVICGEKTKQNDLSLIDSIKLVHDIKYLDYVWYEGKLCVIKTGMLDIILDCIFFLF